MCKIFCSLNEHSSCNYSTNGIVLNVSDTLTLAISSFQQCRGDKHLTDNLGSTAVLPLLSTSAPLSSKNFSPGGCFRGERARLCSSRSSGFSYDQSLAGSAVSLPSSTEKDLALCTLATFVSTPSSGCHASILVSED